MRTEPATAHLDTGHLRSVVVLVDSTGYRYVTRVTGVATSPRSTIKCTTRTISAAAFLTRREPAFRRPGERARRNCSPRSLTARNASGALDCMSGGGATSHENRAGKTSRADVQSAANKNIRNGSMQSLPKVDGQRRFSLPLKQSTAAPTRLKQPCAICELCSVTWFVVARHEYSQDPTYKGCGQACTLSRRNVHLHLQVPLTFVLMVRTLYNGTDSYIKDTLSASTPDGGRQETPKYTGQRTRTNASMQTPPIPPFCFYQPPMSSSAATWRSSLQSASTSL